MTQARIERVELRKKASDLLSDGTVEVFLGYEEGTLPLSVTPSIIHASARVADEKAKALMFDRRCQMNLANYLHKFKGKRVGLVVKGCDSRSVTGLIQERQVQREDLVLLGAPCDGVLDRGRVLSAGGGAERVQDAAIEGEEVHLVLLDGRQKRLPLKDIIHPSCRGCSIRNPVMADFLIAEPVPQPAVPEFAPELEKLKAACAEERWENFSREMSKCILCYACRNLCPACYCKRCFADASKPRIMTRTDNPADAMMFHLVRLMHLAGRCTGCGACVRGCPAGVDLRPYNDNLRAHVLREYGFMAGTDPQTQPPLARYAIDDCNEFVM